MRRVAVVMVLLGALAACGADKSAGDAVGTLPTQFVVVQTGLTGRSPRVALHRLSGGRIASLLGWAVAGDQEVRAPDRKLYRFTRAGLVRVDKISGDGRGTDAAPLCFRDLCVSSPESKDEPAITLGPKRIVGAPHERYPEGGWLGIWRDARLSPDGRTVLATWSGECESPSAYLVDVATGRLVSPESAPEEPRESFAVGWARNGEAIVYFTTGICGTGAPTPGVYAVHADGSGARLIARVSDDSAVATLVTLR